MFEPGDKIRCIDDAKGVWQEHFSDHVIEGHVYVVDGVYDCGNGLIGVTLLGITSRPAENGTHLSWAAARFVRLSGCRI